MFFKNNYLITRRKKQDCRNVNAGGVIIIVVKYVFLAYPILHQSNMTRGIFELKLYKQKFKI